MTVAVPFPETLPPGYAWLDDEPAFDPTRHLALEEPSEVVMLVDLGYDAAEIETKATPVAATSPFRLLSPEGADVMLQVSRRLEQFHAPAGERIERVVRGGCYRSRWLRDLCLSTDVTAHLRDIYGIPIAPHPMPLQLGHLNYAPTAVDQAIDKWHHDTLPLDYVMPVTDPAQVSGGRFEYFLGTKQEAADLARADQTPPPERTVAPHFPGPGYAIALHGDMVVHRAAPLSAPCERTTMVNGYVALDATGDEQSRTRDLASVDDREVLYAEWARFAAWRAKQRLSHLIDTIDFTTDQDAVADTLEEAIADVARAAREMRSGDSRTDHYGG